MPSDCEHNIPEVKKGMGPSAISFEVLKRSGKPNWWCRTHGCEASAPDGAALEACPGSWFDPVPADRQLDIDLASGEYAVWGVVPPAIELGSIVLESGKVHVHHRATTQGTKDIDTSFDIVRVISGERQLVVDGMAAAAFSLSELSGMRVRSLTCPHCGGEHIDELKFATFPHSKHLCNACGRNFRDGSGVSISNPLADAYSSLDLPPPQAPIRPERPLDLRRADYAAVAVWPSNAAILSTMARPEEVGIHVHAWSAGGELQLDDTFAPVSIDGGLIDEAMLHALACQRTVAHGAPIISLPCSNCGAALLSPRTGWIEPRTTHVCESCGATTRTRRKTFVNPLAEKG